MAYYEMTKEKVLKILSKFEKGEYNLDNLEEQFLKVCPKSLKRKDAFFDEYILNHNGFFAYIDFMVILGQIKYGLEYATNRHICYIGTNDLNTIIIK